MPAACAATLVSCAACVYNVRSDTCCLLRSMLSWLAGAGVGLGAAAAVPILKVARLFSPLICMSATPLGLGCGTAGPRRAGHLQYTRAPRGPRTQGRNSGASSGYPNWGQNVGRGTLGELCRGLGQGLGSMPSVQPPGQEGFADNLTHRSVLTTR